MKKFWKKTGSRRPDFMRDCSSYNFGLPLKTCMRICSVIGMISSIMYIIAGTSLITHISQHERATFSSYVNANNEKTRHVYYKRNAGFFIGIAIVLVLINLVQLASDALLFHSTLKGSKSKSLWVFFLLDVILWILTLICFVTIFSGGGLFLLLVFLLGTAIRAYIVFILHEFMTEESKIHGEADFDGNNPHEMEQNSRPSSYKVTDSTAKIGINGDDVTVISIDNKENNDIHEFKKQTDVDNGKKVSSSSDNHDIVKELDTKEIESVVEVKEIPSTNINPDINTVIDEKLDVN